MVTKLESNNWVKEKKDYIKEALDYTGKELSQLQRASFIEKLSNNRWNYRLDTVKTYLEGIKNDYSYLNLSKNKTTTVMATQIALFKAWYMWVWHIDAKWWSYTMGCIRKFQSENWLPVSWYLTRRTVEKLLTVAAEKQWWAPETKQQKKQETKKPATKPRTPTPTQKKPISTPDRKKIDTPQESQPSFLELDTTKIRNAVKDIWEFDMYQNFIIKNGKEISKGNNKYLKILWTEYVEWKEWIDNDGALCYHNWQDYFMFWRSQGWWITDWVKVSYWWEVIEKWTFSATGDLEIQEKINPLTQQKYKTGKREFLNAQVKDEFENPDPTPSQYEHWSANQPG